MTLEDTPGRQTYGQILKSTAQIGGSSVVNIAFSIIRNKAIAVLLGPAGVGLISLYGAIFDLAQSLAGLGIQNSGVRQIAEAAGSGDMEKIARTATVLRRVSIILGLLGGALLVAFAAPVSRLTFGDEQQAAGVALLAIAVFFKLISTGQGALIQGMRRISDLARMNILAAFFSTVFTVPLIYFLGEDGIVPSLIAMAAASILTSWWYSRKIKINSLPMPLSQMLPETAMLLKLGIAFMLTGFLSLGTTYVVRIIVLRHDGVEAAGMYQAAWALAGLYTGVILQALGADFYPRLAAVAKDNPECNRLVNEQAQVSVLLAGPGVIATLVFAPLVMEIFYSAEFRAAVGLLRWVSLGMMLRVVSWPMGLILLAKGEQKLFLATEVAATFVHVGLAWPLVNILGIDGAGAAFCLLYVWHTAFVYVIVRKISGFRWSSANVRVGAIFVSATTVVFCGFLFLPAWPATGLGVAGVLLTGLYSLRNLLRFFPSHLLPVPIRRWVA
ncbi:O-antigen translocase [Microvirga flavescens]|uniref:O-antigen translocase n=1 Tax=Microvirga flavescens TaxID=2249811 RepID=UPI000DDB9AEB|nr:O-antigen translocase [Microvirga flavescens]